MRLATSVLILGGTLLAVVPALFSADAAFSPRGKVLFSDDLAGPEMTGWNGKPGTWEFADGAVKVSEKQEDKHAAVRRHPLKYHDAIFEFWFRFDGARTIALSLNQKGGHTCRLMITPRNLVLQADQPTPTSDLKAVRMAASNVTLEAGKWHKAVVEVHGPVMLAQVDDNPILSAENARVDVDKIDFGLPVGGVSAELKQVKIFAVR